MQLVDLRRPFVDSLIASGFELGEGRDEQQILVGTIGDHRVRIELGPGFPFYKPRVFPDDVRGARHQEVDGALCLYPDDSPDGWMPYFSVSALLERIDGWFEAYSSGFDGGPDLELPDTHLYYPGAHPMVMYGDGFEVPAGVRIGAFGLWVCSDEVVVASGLSEGPAASPRIEPAMRDLFDVSSTAALWPGIWVVADKELDPQPNLGELADAVELNRGPSAEVLLNALSGKAGSRLSAPQPIAIAVRYPTPANSDFGWLFLRMSLSRGWRTGLTAVGLESYEPAPTGKSALARRVGTRPIRDKKIVVFGCGAIGSTVAVMLAREGAAQIVLVDSDRVRPTNVVRHEALFSSSATFKVAAVSARIRQAAPYCDVVTKLTTWDPRKLEELAIAADLVVCATGSPAFESLVNLVSISAGRPAVYVGAYNNAGVGRINLVRPGSDACLECVSQLKNENHYPLLPAATEDVISEVGCNHATSVASPLDLNTIAIEAVRGIESIMTSSMWNLSDVVNTDQGDGRLVGAPRILRECFRPVPSCATCGSPRRAS